MNEDKQIQSMIDFIEREAQEKAEELDQAAQEEYDVEKMRLVEAEKAKIRTQTEAKKKQVEIDRRVAQANHAKSQRQRVMEERARLLEDLRAATQKKIVALVNDSTKYRQLLSDLIRQSAAAIQADASVQCRKADEAMVKKALPEAESWLQAQMKKTIKLTVAKDNLNDEESWGGVVLTSADGKIVCNNTLAYRMEHAFKEQLPTVRYQLFNDKAPALK